MSQVLNVYCDESCHLENDHQTAMVLGAVWCPFEKTVIFPKAFWKTRINLRCWHGTIKRVMVQ
jgi:hypothetical protein